MSAYARDWRPTSGATSAFLFAYTVDRGRQPEFVAGYQSHLQWHVEHRDHLAWYGWFVTNGPRAESFVDGAFGVTLEEYSRRPALADDARHFAETVAPFSTPQAFTQLVLWPEVSTAFSLESWAPSQTLDVWLVDLEPSAQTEFERALTQAARGSHANESALRWTWYRVVSGGRLASYLVVSPRASIVEATGDRSSLPHLAALAYGLLPGSLTALSSGVRNVQSETWSYRADLSLFPEHPS